MPDVGATGAVVTEGLNETLPASGPGVGGSRAGDPNAPAGGRLGRYIVLSKLGAGAMGIVFAAHDPELDRKVAIKLLKLGEWDGNDARLRLQREAQALARLAHANVVAVYDVGVHENQLFLAMEFVCGQTLGAWMRSGSQPRPWRDVVRVFVQAGRGLAAAHGAGLIHRDFKPDNGMISDDGHVRVMDFGLVALATGDHGNAVALLEQALHVLQSGALSPATLDEIRFALARALWNAESPLDHRRSRELAKSATFKHGERAVQLRAERDAWLAAPARSKAPPVSGEGRPAQ